jgi:hypothetical protein
MTTQSGLQSRQQRRASFAQHGHITSNAAKGVTRKPCSGSNRRPFVAHGTMQRSRSAGLCSHNPHEDSPGRRTVCWYVRNRFSQIRTAPASTAPSSSKAITILRNALTQETPWRETGFVQDRADRGDPDPLPTGHSLQTCRNLPLRGSRWGGSLARSIVTDASPWVAR